MPPYRALIGRMGGIGLLLVLLLVSGCQTANPIATHRLMEHQASIDFCGLQSTRAIASLKLVGAVPRGWESLEAQNRAFYTHEQWRSPSKNTGVGAVHVRMPLPLSASAILWLARQQYVKFNRDGRLIAEWTDNLDRPWFEAESKKYRVCGFAMTEGNSAWIVYFGYKVGRELHTDELSLAARAAETFIPLRDAPQADGPKMAEGQRMPWPATE